MFSGQLPIAITREPFVRITWNFNRQGSIVGTTCTSDSDKRFPSHCSRKLGRKNQQFFLLTLWFCEIFKLPRVMWVGEMGVWWSWPGQQGDTLVMRWGWGHLSNRGQEGDTLVMRWGWGHLSNKGQDGDTLVMRWGWGHLSNRGQEGDT